MRGTFFPNWNKDIEDTKIFTFFPYPTKVHTCIVTPGKNQVTKNTPSGVAFFFDPIKKNPLNYERVF